MSQPAASPSPSASSLRQRLGHWVESNPVQHLIIAVIVINAIVLGLETVPAINNRFGSLLGWLDAAALTIFVIEIGLKLWAHGLRFFRSAWNVFDLVVVGIALVPASGPLAVLRALRVLRVLRLASMMPQLRFVVEALLSAIPGIGAIAGLMLILFYIAAVISTGLFGERFPEFFGGLGASLYTLFQVMTLESWSMGVVRPVMEEFPWAWAFFIPFILLATFTMLNLFIAIIVNTMQTLHDGKDDAHNSDTDQPSHDAKIDLHALHADIRALRAELAALQAGTPGAANATDTRAPR